MTENIPWLGSYGEVPFHLEYSTKSMCDTVLDTAAENADFPALTFFGRKIKFSELASNIDRTARSFYSIGVRKGMRVMVCLPNVPQAIYCLYALNRIGAIATMVHPLSAVGEIVYDLREAHCNFAVTLDQFYPKFLEVMKERALRKLIVVHVSDELPAFTAPFFRFFSESKYPKVDGAFAISWKTFLKEGRHVRDGYVARKNPKEEAVVLFSGGTTGVTKGIKLSDYNFNALAYQTVAMSHETINHSKMLAAMPVFHGFGLGVCIHTMMVAGGTAILVPRFNVKSYALLIKKHRPNFIAGVPSLFEAIARNTYLDGVDLSCLKGVFSGGDSLSIELKKKFDAFLAEHKAGIRIREGYGTTECVTASCLTPYNKEKEGSIGLPYPDTYFKICGVGTNDELPYGQEGEICLCGPTVMLGYIGHEKENADTLRVHADGRVWLHTGDLGIMDDEGFIYFRQRIKRMIITNGYNVYPSQIENVLDAHEAVRMSCVIGVPDPRKMHKVKAFVVLNEGWKDSPQLRESIMKHCSRSVAKYAMPYMIEVCDDLPKTLVGKVAYTKLS